MPEAIEAAHAPDAFWHMATAMIEGPYTPVLHSCITVARQAIRDNFTSSATPDNADWPPRKIEGDGHRLLMDTGALMQAAVGTGTGAMMEVGTHEASTGVSGAAIPYAAAHNYGYPERNLPQREFLGADGESIDDMADLIADYVIDELLAKL